MTLKKSKRRSRVKASASVSDLWGLKRPSRVQDWDKNCCKERKRAILSYPIRGHFVSLRGGYLRLKNWVSVSDLCWRQAGDGDSDGGVAGGDEASQPGDGQTTSSISQLLDSFSHRLNLHQTHDDINSDLQNLLDSLGNLSLKKASCTSTPTST